MNLFLTLLILTTVAISLAEDIRRQKIPNLVTFPSTLLAIGYHFMSNGLEGFLFSILGMCIGIALFIVPYMMGGMGAGDVKLMGSIGAMVGSTGILLTAFAVYLFGGVYGFMLMVVNPRYGYLSLKKLWTTIKTFFLTAQFVHIPHDQSEKQPVLCFAIPIAVGTLSYLFIINTEYELFSHTLSEQFTIWGK